jgi:cytidylate kinase
MPIITISRGAYSCGGEVAEKVAEKQGYRCVSREILREASEQFHIPEAELLLAIKDTPSFLGRFTYAKEKYIAYVRAALLKHVRKGNVVYHGLAGHFLLRDVPKVFMVRIVADMEDRISEVMRRDNISADEARAVITRDDEERRRWSLQLFGVDTWNTDIYDMVLNIKSMTVNDAVELISETAKRPCFEHTPESQKTVENLALAAQVQAALMEEFPTADVSAKEGRVFVGVKGSMSQEKKLVARAREIAEGTEGVEETVVHFVPFMTPD